MLLIKDINLYIFTFLFFLLILNLYPIWTLLNWIVSMNKLYYI